MKFIPLPALQDDALWLLHDGQRALVVDSGDAQPVLDCPDHSGLKLQAILVTHHHTDHTGGVDTPRNATGACVWGPASERIPGPLERLNDGDHSNVLGLAFEVPDVPGHTAGQIAYDCADVDGRPVLFCGEPLFSDECGHIFKRTPQQMLTSVRKLGALPGATRVCCARGSTLGSLTSRSAVDRRTRS